jgi:hypothetical protein
MPGIGNWLAEILSRVGKVGEESSDVALLLSKMGTVEAG